IHSPPNCTGDSSMSPPHSVALSVLAGKLDPVVLGCWSRMVWGVGAGRRADRGVLGRPIPRTN
ncbi:MAG: hypothetical protein LC749_19600, partial [Actinobacteria bacterium]|nr:hypothetical protein [Actinomycetota bacterium]